jgi:hypothetical protein
MMEDSLIVVCWRSSAGEEEDHAEKRLDAEEARPPGADEGVPRIFRTKPCLILFCLSLDVSPMKDG